MKLDSTPAATRAYRQTARAEAAEETARRIRDAAHALFSTKFFAGVTLREIADHAGVTLQTVLRRFGSKDELFNAVAKEQQAKIVAARTPERPDDVASAVEALFGSYEVMGDMNWRALVQEDQLAGVHDLLQGARRMHREWIERHLAFLLPRAGKERERRITLLFAATDFYLWKLMRVDLDLPRGEAQGRMTELVRALEAQLRKEER